jgi:hypothetical protein
MGVPIFALFVNAIGLSWAMSLETKGCSCVHDWRRKFLKLWYVFSISLALLAVVHVKPPVSIVAPLGLVSVFAFGTLLSALWSVERQKCACAQDWREKVLLATSALALLGLFMARLGK